MIHQKIDWVGLDFRLDWVGLGQYLQGTS